MKLTIAGKDESEGLGRELSAAAEARAHEAAPRFLTPEHSALTLKDCADEREYQDRYVRLMGLHYDVKTEVEGLIRPGLVGKLIAAVKGALWKLIRFRVERFIQRQNVVNEMLSHAVEFENDRLRKEVAELRGQLATHGHEGRG